MSTPLTPRSFLLALLITLIWGVNFVVIKLSVSQAPPLFVAALRFTLAALPAVFFVPRPQMRWRTFLGYGVSVGVVQFGLLYLAIQLGLSAGLASLLMQMQAFFTALLAAALLRERLPGNQWLGMGLAFGGMAVIGLIADHHTSALGLVLVLIAALGWSISNVLVKSAGRANMLSLVVWSALIPPIPLTLMSGLTSGWASIGQTLLHSGPGFWAAIAFMGYFNTVLGFGVWNWLIQQHGAGRVAPLSLLVPVFGMLSSALYFQEAFPPLKLLGAVLVFAGLLLHVFGGRLGFWTPRKPVLKRSPSDPS
ncbi:EamA family transporter [Deinococcus irradiatisoli]|uniref:EamA family transporter n=1 Tax=Deinococcus irradiatisoli TaxID=2202254 RepID=A0A2Z3JHB9_9DEIO|nr:EamA family transporter [Deinococcus irradiatisoli]AWN22760.1 EamA family transporter [Deinococcus irradiatisoli]